MTSINNKKYIKTDFQAKGIRQRLLLYPFVRCILRLLLNDVLDSQKVYLYPSLSSVQHLYRCVQFDIPILLTPFTDTSAYS